MNKVVRWLERLFRHVFVYPVLKLFLHNPPVPIPLHIKNIRKILILRYDRIGDVVVTMPIFRILKRANPDLFLGVLASPTNAELLLHEKNVDRIHILDSNVLNLFREIRSARKEGYELVLNFIFNRTTSGGLLANYISPRGIKIGQGAEKYRFYFNVLLKLSRGSKHMAEVLGDIVSQVFGLKVSEKDLVLELPADADAEMRVSEFLSARNLKRRGTKKGRGKEYVVLNLSATDSVRKISENQSHTILEVLTADLLCNVVVIASPNDEMWRDNLVKSSKEPRCWSFPESGTAGLREIAELVGGAKAVVTPDTAIVHLASATKTPVLGLFTPLQIAAEWLPFKVKHRAVFAEEGLPASAIRGDLLRSELRQFIKDCK